MCKCCSESNAKIVWLARKWKKNETIPIHMSKQHSTYFIRPLSPSSFVSHTDFVYLVLTFIMSGSRTQLLLFANWFIFKMKKKLRLLIWNGSLKRNESKAKRNDGQRASREHTIKCLSKVNRMIFAMSTWKLETLLKAIRFFGARIKGIWPIKSMPFRYQIEPYEMIHRLNICTINSVYFLRSFCLE